MSTNKKKAFVKEQNYKVDHTYNHPMKDPKLDKEIEKWYKKLEKSGFQDIELNTKMTRQSGEVFLNSYEPPSKATTAIAKQKYYAAWSTYFAHHEPYYKTKKDAIMHEAMGEGLTFNQISELLRKRRFRKSVSVDSVKRRIKSWEFVVMTWNAINANGEFYTPPNNVWRNEHHVPLALKRRIKNA